MIKLYYQNIKIRGGEYSGKNSAKNKVEKIIENRVEKIVENIVEKKVYYSNIKVNVFFNLY